MKKIALMLVLFSSIALTSLAQTADSLKVETSEIKFNSTEIDYGVITKGADGERVFEFTNTGKQPLVLSNVSASCGCTVVEWVKDPIKPGDKGSFKVKYNTNIVGTFHKVIRVFSNAPQSPVMLTIKGEVKPSEEGTSQN
ncbi:MAG: DUF1573 domain-containing protein [Bacteroidales bacterium]